MFGFGGVEMARKMWLFAFIEHRMEVDESMKGKVWDFLSVWWSLWTQTLLWVGWLFVCERKSDNKSFVFENSKRVIEGMGRERISKGKKE